MYKIILIFFSKSRDLKIKLYKLNFFIYSSALILSWQCEVQHQLDLNQYRNSNFRKTRTVTYRIFFKKLAKKKQQIKLLNLFQIKIKN